MLLKIWWRRFRFTLDRTAGFFRIDTQPQGDLKGHSCDQFLDPHFGPPNKLHPLYINDYAASRKFVVASPQLHQ